MLNPLHLRTLVEVVVTGSFARAARRTGYTASAVSQQIAALERAVGTPLFEREAHGIRPTGMAFTIAERARESIAVLDSLERDIRDVVQGRSGRLRLGTFPTAGERLVPSAVAELTRSHPGAEILLDEAEPDDLLPQVQKGDLDLTLVFAYDLVPRVWPVELTVFPLIEETLVVLVPAGHHALRRSDGIDLADLADERWVASRPGTAGATSLFRICAVHMFAPRVAFRSNDYDVVQGLVAAGAGVAIVPGLAYQPREGMVAVPLAQTPSHRRVFALYRTANHNPLLKAALDAFVLAGRGLQGRFVRADESIRSTSEEDETPTTELDEAV
ncbi:LysR family transcriptional regulator [Embleya hyalina]|uniref:LysR family transcriptional regulator n=1 Tax=Embleya hyalina TaxID=516124 RepID=A0A401YDH2_9ACTN|nr:LysR family transcriptional regulator [Embleya hyalina]GCD92635.1 LysR family transcriptional regulator [Embleya hyalina]